MGQAASSLAPAGAPPAAPLAAPFNAACVKSGPPFVRSARYVRLTAPGGNTVHVLGVVPCSTLSAEEAAALVRTARPQALYIDVPPELVGVLREDVRVGRLCDAQKVPESSPLYSPFLYPGVGPVATIAVRNFLADNDMAQLLGCEMFAPWKAALAAGAALPEPPASVLSFPLSLTHNYVAAPVDQSQLTRPGHIGLHISGNAQVASTHIGAYLGNSALLIAGGASDAESSVELPPSGYLTRTEVSALQARFRGAVNAFAARATPESCDPETALAAREALARAEGEVALADHLSALALASQRQSQVVAHELHAAADALPPGSSLVAVVNMGGLASLQRNWAEARPAAELFPSPTFVQQAIGVGVGSAAVGGVGYGLYRAGRRFPRTVGLLTLVAGGTIFGAAAFGVHSDNVRYGTTVRSALARPRITTALTKA